MILLWGPADDPPLSAVRRTLDECGSSYWLLDQREATPEYEFRFGHSACATVSGVDLNTVSAAYIRPFDYGALSDNQCSDEICRSRRFSALLTTWLEASPLLILNRFSVQASNTSKLFQARMIQQNGFAFPATMATNEPSAARAFAQQHNVVIYKSLSSVRSIVKRLEVEDFEGLEDVRSCPTLLQEYVGGPDYRVHVVGRQAFAAVMFSESDDYRYDGGTSVTNVDLPGEVVARCISLSHALGLAFSGIDLRRGADGTWYCFEVNPSPGFPYFDRAEGAPIAKAVARLLGNTCPALGS